MSDILLAEQATPSTPSAGQSLLYPGTDGKWHYKDDEGVEHTLADEDTLPTDAVYRKNAIINGRFDIWQNGNTFAGIVNTQYCADQWQYLKSGAMVHTVSQVTDVPTLAESGVLFTSALSAEVTTADASIAAGDFCTIGQLIEGYYFIPLAQRALNLSFWVKSPKTGVHCVAIHNSDNTRSFVGEYTVDAANTWEKKTVTLTATPSTGTWLYTNGVGLRVLFTLASGSTYHGTADIWSTGNFLSTSNQVNVCDTVGNIFKITGVQLERGSSATTFDDRPYPEELALCQRYFYDSRTAANAHGGIAGANSFIVTSITFPVPMCDTPTCATYNGTTASRVRATATGTSIVAGFNGIVGNKYGISVLSFTGAPLTVNTLYDFNIIANARLS